MKRILIGLIISVMVTACTGYNNLKLIYTDEVPEIIPKKGMAKIVIFNGGAPKPYDGYAIYFARKYVGQLYHKTYITLDVKPGDSFITAAQKYHVIASKHVFEEGKVYFLGLDSTVTFTYGVMSRRPLGFYPIDKLTAQQLMIDFKYYYLKSGSVDIIDPSAFEVEENIFYRDLKEHPEDYTKFLQYKGVYIFPKYETNLDDASIERIMAFYSEQTGDKALASGFTPEGIQVVGMSYTQLNVKTAKHLALEKCKESSGTNCEVININGVLLDLPIPSNSFVGTDTNNDNVKKHIEEKARTQLKNNSNQTLNKAKNRKDYTGVVDIQNLNEQVMKCTTDQVLQMKAMEMTDIQIKAACE